MPFNIWFKYGESQPDKIKFDGEDVADLKIRRGSGSRAELSGREEHCFCEEATEITFKSIARDGLPLLGGQVGLESSSSKNESHEEADIINSKFSLINDLSLAETPSTIWLTYKNSGYLSYASEADIANYVNIVLRDTIHAMGRSDNIMLYAEMAFRSQRPDIWVICCNSLSVGFIKIKKPSDTIMDEPLLAGQLHKTDTATQMNIVSKPQSVSNPSQSPLVICLPRIPCFDKANQTSILVIRHDVFSSTNKNLPRAIASILSKIAASFR
ncbi:11341_t:CDS:2 [Funneliformis caledonium]|uniref:11341_t:CDS:1 n=1 Tax=Funneliformis caledonium TaxID=1117310 RepID=A0A9N8YPZ4_9GLOM|nr:11341_t:CDS:2 [Funneliformis caledonium]